MFRPLDTGIPTRQLSRNAVASGHVLGFWGTEPPDRTPMLADQVQRRLASLGVIPKAGPLTRYRQLGDRLGIWGLMQGSGTHLRPVFAASDSTHLESRQSNRIESASARHLGHPSDQPEQYLGLSASGLVTCELPDGTALPDSWIWLGASLRLGRDPFGRVPLYWWPDRQASATCGDTILIWFSTRLQLLIPILDADPEINLEAVYGYAGCSYIPTPHTPIAGIHALPAATELIWDGRRPSNPPQQDRYWQWRQAPSQLTDEESAIAQLQHLLSAAVERQLTGLTGEKVGVFLSGGLDSSIVAALLAKAGVDLHAYCLDFGEDQHSELPYAQQVADALGIPLTAVKVTPRQVKRAIAQTAQALDLPFGDGVTVPLYLLNQAAATDGVRVVFNGEHGDQLFAGWTNKPLIAAGIYTSVPDLPTAAAQRDLAQQYLKTFHRLHGYESQTFAPEILAQIRAFDPQAWLADSLSRDYCQTFFHQMRRATLMLKGAQNIQPRATALAWSHGLQVRSPFCDLALANWSFQLAGALQLRGNCEKYILKRAVEPWLPPEIVWRDKRGMGVPLTHWCFEHLWHDLGQWLNPATLRAEGLWHLHLPGRVASYRLGGIQGRRIGEILWLLVMWQMWRRHGVGDRPLKPLGPSPWLGSLDHPFWLPRWLWTFICKEFRQ